MEGIIEWLSYLPLYISNALGWLTDEITIGNFSFTPLAMIGVSFGTFAAVVLILKIKNLII